MWVLVRCGACAVLVVVVLVLVGRDAVKCSVRRASCGARGPLEDVVCGEHVHPTAVVEVALGRIHAPALAKKRERFARSGLAETEAR